MHSAKDTTRVRRLLLTWYARHGRAFPWRATAPRSPDPYVVLVSEVMLQQTQAVRIAERLPHFLHSFPTVRKLALATNGTMIRAWKGLGYNSRALRLRDAARVIVERHEGIIPSSVDTLRALPGIGPYTSAAVACFAYGAPAIVLDVNVRRVYSRLMAAQACTTDVGLEADLADVARRIIPPRRASDWHHAVMDLGATICTARRPACTACPLQRICPSAGRMIEAVRTHKVETSFRGEPVRIWRGRIVAYVQDHADVTLRQLFRGIAKTTATADDLLWLRGVVASLERDGMLVVSEHTVSLAM